MKKKIGILLLVVAVAAAMLAAFHCDHEWLDATCTDPVTCGLCDAAEGEPLGHSWTDADCVTPRTCAVCAETQGDPLGHSWAEAGCVTPRTCTVCAETQGDPLGHSWAEAGCVTPQTCTVCAETQGDPLGHNWAAATCKTPQTCTVCAVTEGGLGSHSWKNATCTAPQTCEICGATTGEKLAHNWKNATCTAPQTCRSCGGTQGSALGHSWGQATCSSPAACSVCGAANGKALGHKFVKNSDGKTQTCSVCNSTVDIKYVAITFDDGPSGNITRTLLSGLSARGAKATFFLCGYRIESYGSLPAEIASYGHELALHTDNHSYLSKLSADEIRKELADNLALLPEGCNVTLLRPPGGFFNDTVKQVCAEMGLSIIMWSLDPQDWATSDASTIENRVVNQVKAGDVILMHDLKSSSVTAALNIIDTLHAQGYEFVTVSQLAQIYGKTLQPGTVYYSMR